MLVSLKSLTFSQAEELSKKTVLNEAEAKAEAEKKAKEEKEAAGKAAATGMGGLSFQDGFEAGFKACLIIIPWFREGREKGRTPSSTRKGSTICNKLKQTSTGSGEAGSCGRKCHHVEQVDLNHVWVRTEGERYGGR